MKIIPFVTTTLCLLSYFPNLAAACDSCAIYIAAEALGESTNGWFTSAATQYTDFGTTQLDGHEVSNEANQHLTSSITQAIVGYNFTPRFSAQLNLPFIHRSYERPEGFNNDQGSETGIGDASFIGRFLITRQDQPDTTLIWNLLAGVKLPTGSSARLQEEFAEVEVPGAPKSGIHGHDLALGSGSFDGLIGTSAYFRYRHAFITAAVQYAIRSQGDYDYRYANALSWESGIGGYLILTEQHTLTLQAMVTGDYKTKDNFQGNAAVDTASNAIYLGPKLVGTWGKHGSAELGVELPVKLQNSDFQTVPDVRVRGGITWRF